MSSQLRTYVRLCVAVTVVFVVLLSGTLGESVNTSYGQFTQSLADQTGTMSSGTGLNGSIYYGNALNDNAGAFIHLPYGAMLALMWTMLAGFLLLTLSGVRQKSLAMTTVPGLTFIVVSTMVGGGYLALGPKDSATQHPVLSVAILTALGVTALLLSTHMRAAVVRRKPEIITSAETTESVEGRLV